MNDLEVAFSKSKLEIASLELNHSSKYDFRSLDSPFIDLIAFSSSSKFLSLSPINQIDEYRDDNDKLPLQYSSLRQTRECKRIAEAYKSITAIKRINQSFSKKRKIKTNIKDSIDGFVYQIRFKKTHRYFVLSDEFYLVYPSKLQLGDFVKVEADRGIDLGVILAIIPLEDFEEPLPTAGLRGRSFSFDFGSEIKYIVDLASANEVLLIQEKRIEEDRILKIVKLLCLKSSLPLKILDCEYQYDKHKLTIYFEAAYRVDFRNLVFDLFSLFKTRIWLHQVEPHYSIISKGFHHSNLIAIAAGFICESEQ
jgi:hypothetical protein